MKLDFSFISEYMPVFIKGAETTLIISLISVVMGVLLGSIIYFMKSSDFINFGGIKPLKIVANIYVEIIRGTPMLLQVMMVYFGSSEILKIKNMEEITAVIIAISMNSAAYVCEIIRAGIEAVDKGQIEAARSLGMTNGQAMRLVVIPQAVKNILPAIGNEFVAVIKESSIGYVIGAVELSHASKVVSGAIYKAFEPLMVSAVFYFIMTFSLGRLIAYFERRMKKSDSC